MIMPDYWENLTPRQRLNDAVHKYAQATGCGYADAWRAFERQWNAATGGDIGQERREYELRYGSLPTMPLYLEIIGKLNEAVELALTLR